MLGANWASGAGFRHANNIKHGLSASALGFRFAAARVSVCEIQLRARRNGIPSDILRGMGVGPAIAIVGAGNLATALVASLRRAGYEIDEIIGRASSLKNVKRLASTAGARASVAASARLSAAVVWFCVPDAEIAAAAAALAPRVPWKGKIALHSSGALSSDELGALRRRGASVGSVHPLMTFVRGSQLSLSHVPFAIEGDVAAARMARRIVKDLGGFSYSLRKADKAAYHAWGTFASPLLTALLATTEQVAGIAGVRPKASRQRMIPILLQTLANYAAFGPPGAFSGPIVRGDVETVRRHLHVLGKKPAAKEVYLALARAALLYLPVRNQAQLKQILRAAKK